MLKNGLNFRVGDGSTINILTDPWLPCQSDPYVHTRSQEIEDKLVCSLLNSDQTQWDVDLVMDIFEVRDASLILATPLNNNSADSW